MRVDSEPMVLHPYDLQWVQELEADIASQCEAEAFRP